MKIVRRYISTHVLTSMLVLCLLLMGIEVLIGFMTEMRDLGHGDYNIAHAFIYVLLDLPHSLYSLFPMVALLGCLIGLGRLSSSQELIAMRASGIAKGQIFSIVLLSALFMMFFAFLLGEVIGPHTKRLAETRKAIAVSDGQAIKSMHGFWVRDGSDFIHINTVLPRGRLEGVTIYRIDDSYRLVMATYAEHAVYLRGRWTLEKVRRSNISENKVTSEFFDALAWGIKVSPRLLGLSRTESNEMTLLELNRYLKYRARAGLDGGMDAIEFWKRLFQPLSIGVMMLLAVPFIFGSLRKVPMGVRLLTGILVGFTFYIFNEVLGPLSLVMHISPVLSALLPTAVFAVVGLLLMRRV